MMSKLFSKIVDDEQAEAGPSRDEEMFDVCKSERTCSNCGVTDGCKGRVYPTKTGSVVRPNCFTSLHRGKKTSTTSSDHDEDCSSQSIGKRLLTALKQTFAKRKTDEEPIQHLQEILGDLKFLNGWLEGRVSSNESRFSYWKNMLDNEERQLEDNYSAFKGSQQSLDLMRCRVGSVNEELISRVESERRRQQEIEQMEAVVRRHEPSLYRKYQILQGKAGNKDVAYAAIRTSIDDKRMAIEKMEFLLSMWKENIDQIDESRNENNLTMILPTKMPMQAARPLASSGRGFRFVFPIEAASAATSSEDDLTDSI